MRERQFARYRAWLETRATCSRYGGERRRRARTCSISRSRSSKNSTRSYRAPAARVRERLADLTRPAGSAPVELLLLAHPVASLPDLARHPRSSGSLRQRGFRLLVGTQLTSNLADRSYAVALPWYVLADRSGVLMSGTVLAAHRVPLAVLMAAGGMPGTGRNPARPRISASGRPERRQDHPEHGHQIHVAPGQPSGPPVTNSPTCRGDGRGRDELPEAPDGRRSTTRGAPTCHGDRHPGSLSTHPGSKAGRAGTTRASGPGRLLASGQEPPGGGSAPGAGPLRSGQAVPAGLTSRRSAPEMSPGQPVVTVEGSVA